uniref:Methylmalonyl-CoA epimerase, mitochondrial n=1 Tax=Arcella intermedia TaxID=1963864 RepID=A0A6B2LM95_9EUKA
MNFSSVPQTPPVLHKLGKLNHVAIAVPDLEAAKAFYRDILGANVTPSQALPDHGVTVSFAQLGETKIELLHPLGDKSPILNFLSKNQRGGIHHICLDVNNLTQAVKTLAQNNIKPLAPPKIGSHGKRVVFLNPKDCLGVLVELEEDIFPPPSE